MKRLVILLLLGFGVLGVAKAGSDEIASAKGITIAGIVYEKCTGRTPPPDRMQRIANLLQAQGMDIDDIRQGFAEGIVYAEGTYPGHTKPPKAECAKATKMYQQLVKFL